MDYWSQMSLNYDIAGQLMWLWIWMMVAQLIVYILTYWGLYKINKKLWEPHAWVSFIPVVQIYNYLTASKKSFLHYFVLPFLAVLVSFPLAVFTFWISIIAAYIYMFVMMVKLLHAISLRCKRWAWTTVGFIFIPFIMFPVVAHWLKETSSKSE